jgi:hypothetical protein
MRRRLVPAALIVLSVPAFGCGVFVWQPTEDDYAAAPTETTGGESSASSTTQLDTGSSESSSGGMSVSMEETSTTAETTNESTETGMLTDTSSTSSETTSVTTGPSCGDGTCDPGEDFGNCPDDCDPMCGDGVQEGDEACDDGNDDNADACVAGCVPASCGDGFIQSGGGVEECDDMNQPDAACGDDCKLPRRVVFVSSTAYPGNLGGLGGADVKCTDIAMGAGLTGPFKAWLSDPTGSPSTRFDASVNGFTGIYELVDGTKVADGWGDLADGSLDHPIDKTENVMDGMQDIVAWTNTDGDGAALFVNKHCTNWSTSGGGVKGATGYTIPAAPIEWTVYSDSNCSSPNPLYCIEDHP